MDDELRKAAQDVIAQWKFGFFGMGKTLEKLEAALAKNANTAPDKVETAAHTEWASPSSVSINAAPDELRKSAQAMVDAWTWREGDLINQGERIEKAREALRAALAKNANAAPDESEQARNPNWLCGDGKCDCETPQLCHPRKAESITDAMTDLVDRLGAEAKLVDPRAWEHLLVYAPFAAPQDQDAKDALISEGWRKCAVGQGESQHCPMAEKNAKDAARFRWALPILTGSDDGVADDRALAIAFQLAKGLDGDAAIDAAMQQEQKT